MKDPDLSNGEKTFSRASTEPWKVHHNLNAWSSYPKNQNCATGRVEAKTQNAPPGTIFHFQVKNGLLGLDFFSRPMHGLKENRVNFLPTKDQALSGVLLVSGQSLPIFIFFPSFHQIYYGAQRLYTVTFKQPNRSFKFHPISYSSSGNALFDERAGSNQFPKYSKLTDSEFNFFGQFGHLLYQDECIL